MWRILYSISYICNPAMLSYLREKQMLKIFLLIFFYYLLHIFFLSIWSELTINCKREEQNKEREQDNRKPAKRTEEEAIDVRFNF